VVLYGGSGHAKVILDCIEARGGAVHGIFDDNPDLKELLGVPVLGPYYPGTLPEEPLIVAIGNNRIRHRIAATVRHGFGTAIHPSALLSRHAMLGEGSVVFHQAVVQAGTVAGRHCILNTAATVDHDCRLGDFVHVSPNATLSGNVTVGEGTHIGTGASVIQGVRIGRWCVVGAGAVVVRDIPDYAVAVGVPARVIKTIQP
jgi:sugar O-acyltransferase (sialic acid O-acetyltransferase NeuD family)